MSSPPKPPTTPSPISGAGADPRAPPAYSPPATTAATSTPGSGQPMHPPPSPARAAAQRHVNAMSAAAEPDVQAALADFAVGRVLGKGKFSQVYLVTSKSSGKKFAFKVLSKVDHRPRVMAKLRREIDILHALRDANMYLANEAYDSEDGGTGHGQSQPQVITLRGHPNLVTLYQAFETPSSTILLLEYIAGINLHDFVFESIRLSEGVARGLFRQLVSAVSFCHARGVVHRDLKMGNVMLILAQPPTPPLVASPVSSSTHSQSQDPVPVGSPRRGSEPAIHLSSPPAASSAPAPSGSNQTASRSPATPRHWPRRLELTRSYRLRFRSSIVADPIGEDSYTSPYSPHVHWMHQEIAESGGWLVKLVDFGLGSSFDPQEYRHTAVGSPGYFAPEIALGAEYVGPEVDVWSCGVVLFEMTTGMHPFSAKDLPTLKEIVVRGRFAVPHHVSPELRRTFARLMNTDASRRKNLHVLDVDAWTNVGYDGRSAAYADPEEDLLARYGVEVDDLEYLDGTVVVVEENFGNGESGRRRSLSSPSTAVQAIAAGYGRPRTGTARTNASAPETSPGDWYLPGEASSATPGVAAAADGLLARRTRQDTEASTQSQVQPDELAHRRELARRLRQFNASVPALRTSGGVGGGGMGGMLGAGPSASAHVRALEAAQQHQQQQVHQQYRAYAQHQQQAQKPSAAASQQQQFSTASAGATPAAPPSRSGRHARRASILGHPGLSAPTQAQQQSQVQHSQTQQQQQSAANVLVTGVAPNVEYVTRSAETTAINLGHQQHPQHAPTSPPRGPHQQRHQAQHQQRTALPPDTPRRGSAPAAATSPLPNPPTTTTATRAKPNATTATGAGSHPPTRAEASASMGVQLATAAAAHPALAAATVPLPVPPTVHVLPPSPAAIAAATSTAAAAPPPAPLRMRNVKKGGASSSSANAGGWAGWWPFTASASSGPSRNYSPPLPVDHHTRGPSATGGAFAAAAESGDGGPMHMRRATSPVSPATSGAATAAMGTPNDSTTTGTGTSGSSGFSTSSTNGDGGYHHHHQYAVPTLERGRNGGERTKSKPWYSRLFGAGKSSSGKAAR